ncbi:MAG: hypothetical protein AAF184_10620 [Pseudomonadota bacterium]
MERFFVTLVVAALCTLTSPLALAEDATSVAEPGSDPLGLMIAQIKSWGGGSGPRQRDCQRVCENTQVNCQRGCFGLAETDAQNSCSRQCLVTYLGCAEGCLPGSTGGAANKAKSEDGEASSGSSSG